MDSDEVLLCMGSDLSSRTCLDKFFYPLPVFAKVLERYKSNGLLDFERFVRQILLTLHELFMLLLGPSARSLPHHLCLCHLQFLLCGVVLGLTPAARLAWLFVIVSGALSHVRLGLSWGSVALDSEQLVTLIGNLCVIVALPDRRRTGFFFIVMGLCIASLFNEWLFSKMLIFSL